MTIRNELKAEYRIVEELTREAFWNVYVPGCSEHYYLHKMRKSSYFIPELDLVAELDGKIVGNIVYIHAVIVNDAGEAHEVISFGPVSVLPDYQKQGIGSALIRHSLDKARSLGFTAVCIFGDPRYYSRFGFRCAEKYDIKDAEGKYAVALMALELVPESLRRISGRFLESPVFQMDEQEFQRFENSFPPKEKAVTESQTVFKVLSSLRY